MHDHLGEKEKCVRQIDRQIRCGSVYHRSTFVKGLRRSLGGRNKKRLLGSLVMATFCCLINQGWGLLPGQA